jgi:cobalamin biosynthesis protein CobT
MATRGNIFFESTLEKIARVMSRRHNVDVRIEGNSACTDGDTIWLPLLEEVSDELLSDLNGFLDHEVAHVMFTDFPELRKPKPFVGRFHKELFGSIEDSRIEIELPKKFSGTALNLDRLNQKWGSKVNGIRHNMPWPIRLILCIREIYDKKTPKIDPQIEPILAAIYPQCGELRKCKSTREVLDATAQLIKDINIAREALCKGLPPIPDEELKKMMNQIRGESPVELDPDRKKRKAQKAQGEEQFDPATEYSDEEDGDGEGDNSGEAGEGEGSEKGDAASVSAEQQGSEKGKGKKSAIDGEKTEDGSGESGEDKDGEEKDTESGKEGHEKGKGRLDEKADKTKESKAKDDEEGESGKTKSASHDQHFDGTQELEERKNYASWQDSPVEQQMLNDAADATNSEFDSHVFSSESYMETKLEEVIRAEPKVKTSRGYYYGQDDKIDPKCVSLPFSREYDEVKDFTGNGDRKLYADLKADVMKHINPIKSHLERVLKVKENAKMTPERERGKLNTRSLAKLCFDKSYRTPFKTLTKEETTNVAVTLLIDCSGSMSGDQIIVARQTAIALGEALKAIGITFEALGFNTNDNYRLASKTNGLSAEETARFNRFGTALRLMVFKSFDRNDLVGITNAAAGGANADGESVTWAAKRLAQRKEKRKILIVLSDGQPAYAGANHAVLAGDLKRVISLLPKAGIEPIGIGIQTDDPKLFYPDWVMVDDLQKLSTAVMGKLAKMLEQ